MVQPMYKYLLLSSALMLSACDDGTFTNSDSDFIDSKPGSGEDSDPGSDDDSNPGSDEDSGSSDSATELYVGDEDDMNNLVYDAANDELIINNLPFDGASGRYVNTGGSFLDGFQVYASQQASEDGHVQYYAVHAVAANGRAGAAGTAHYGDYGHGGAMIARNTNNVALPVGRGELLYTGAYAGIRVSADEPGFGSRVTFADGDTEVWVDLLDFDVTGAVHGDVINRSEYDVNGNHLGTLQSIVLNETGNISSGGVIKGTADTYDVTSGSSPTVENLQSGTYTAIFAGANGEQIIGTIRITGDIDVDDSDLGQVQETGVFVATD